MIENSQFVFLRSLVFSKFELLALGLVDLGTNSSYSSIKATENMSAIDLKIPRIKSIPVLCILYVLLKTNEIKYSSKLQNIAVIS